MRDNRGKLIDTIRCTKAASIEILFVGIILLSISYLMFAAITGSSPEVVSPIRYYFDLLKSEDIVDIELDVLNALVFFSAVIVILSGIIEMFYKRIELYEKAIIIKSVYSKKVILRQAIEKIDRGKYKPDDNTISRTPRPLCEIILYGAKPIKLSYRVYIGLNIKILNYQKKYNIPII